jgi:hypothetical protein
MQTNEFLKHGLGNLSTTYAHRPRKNKKVPIRVCTQTLSAGQQRIGLVQAQDAGDQPDILARSPKI